MKLHVGMAFVACLLAYWYSLPALETCILVLTIAMVLTAEMLNTAIEKTLDFLSPDIHEQVRQIKDMAAGAVLIAALGSLLIGYLLFLTNLFD